MLANPMIGALLGEMTVMLLWFRRCPLLVKTDHRDDFIVHVSARHPAFSGREEEAAWWNSHLMTDAVDEIEPVKVRFVGALFRPISVHLDALDHVTLSELAHEQGIDASA